MSYGTILPRLVAGRTLEFPGLGTALAAEHSEYARMVTL